MRKAWFVAALIHHYVLLTSYFRRVELQVIIGVQRPSYRPSEMIPPKFLAMGRALGMAKLYSATSRALSYLMVLRANK